MCSSDLVKQISDTASVDKWVKQIEMFYVVAKTAASRVLVVTSDAECFPAFEKEKSAYNSNVEMLRKVLVKKRCGALSRRRASKPSHV